ncbi:MAG: hypothetical protein QOE33_2189 [Acidobacteriota bacterium]|nr:hypothetical protein [Acidobacteriota bacterium]
MKDAVTHRLETFLRVRQFGVTHDAAFPADSRGKEVLDEIDVSIADLEQHSTAQDSHKLGAKQGTSLLSAARESLREDLTALHKTAHAAARTAPGLAEKFQLPGRMRDQELLARARNFAQEAEPFKQEFLRRGMQTDFFAHLAADITAFEQLIDGRAKEEGARVAATAAIDGAIERGMEAVRELDAVVRNTFRDDAGVLAEWTSASHVERATRVANAGADTPKDNTPQSTPQGTPSK